MPALLSIGELSSRSGKPRSALRYYEDIGLLPQVVRVAGQRKYPVDALRTLAVIGAARAAGLSLDEIKPLIDGSPAQPVTVDRLREVAERHLPAAEVRLALSRQARDWLIAAAGCHCPSLDDCGLFDPDSEDCAVSRRRSRRQ
jgi:MerR family redox-sensitive transcriptional activator SoxR